MILCGGDGDSQGREGLQESESHFGDRTLTFDANPDMFIHNVVRGECKPRPGKFLGDALYILTLPSRYSSLDVTIQAFFS